MVVLNGINAGTVAVASLLKQIQGPLIMPAYGKAGRPIPDHLLTADIFQKHFASGYIVAEFMGLLIRNTLVSPSMTCKLMAACNNSFDYVRVTVGVPSQSEIGGMVALLF